MSFRTLIALLILTVGASAYTEQELYDLKQMRLIAVQKKARIAVAQKKLTEAEETKEKIVRSYSDIERRYRDKKSSKNHSRKAREKKEHADKLVDIKRDIKDIEQELIKLKADYKAYGVKYKKLLEKGK